MRRIILFIILLGLCLLTAAALLAQAQTLRRGLDLGSPLNRPGIYGINIDPFGNAADQAQQLETARQTGFTWARQPFNYQTNDWAASDRLVASVNEQGLRLVAVITGTPPPDPEAYTQFTTDFATRYADQIDVYQIWDEPNLESGWGGPPDPVEYVRLLRSAYTAIHNVDPTSTVILAGLAPTIETGPKNLSDILYLRQLYELGAKPYFDAVAGKPYGFNVSPDDRTVDPNLLNFSRLILLREEMTAYGDGEKFLWSSNFGWNTRPSIWGRVSAEEQYGYTRDAYARAANEWAWAGPLFLETSLLHSPSVDPHEGFAMPNMSGLISRPTNVVLPGTYSPIQLTAYAQFEGDWRFSDLGADIPQTGPANISFTFQGTELALTLRRDNYRAYLFVAIDGQPANALPRDSNGDAYVILTSPDLAPHTDTITLASGLAPGAHTAVIRADRGWDQWAIFNVNVGPNVAPPDIRLPLALASLLGLGSFVGLLISFRRLTFNSRREPPPRWVRLGDLGQTILATAVSVLLWASAWLTWGSDLAQATRKYGDAAPLIITVLTAGLFYYSPFFILTLLCLALLILFFYLRPDLALPLIAFCAPFYLIPRPLWDRAFSMVEILTALAFVSAILRLVPRLRLLPFSPSPSLPLDLSVLFFVIVSTASIFVADVRGVAIREFRVIVLEPALFYLLLRITPLDQKQIWRIVDFFLIGAVVVAAIGLGNLMAGVNLITAEGGVARIRSVFGSPNNLGLFLGRALPIAVAVALLGRQRARRVFYALAALIIGVAIVLSFSKGALLLGVPAAMAVIVIFWGGRRAVVALVGLAAAGGAALIPLSRHPRFANLLNLTSGTSFIRVQLWRSALAMFADHPILGVGLDNFLYAYRGKYILPEAWQEPNLPHAHNIFLDSLTRLGLLGFVATIAMLASFAALAWKTVEAVSNRDLRALTIGLIASMVDMLAHGLVDTGYWFVDLAFVFMMTLGLMTAIYKTCQVFAKRT